MAKSPGSLEQLREQFGPHLNYTPPGGWSEESRTTARPAGEDALLFLRTAVRHSAEGPRQSRHRFRALGGVPVQSRDALPEGREALPAVEPSGPAARSADAHRERVS